MKLGFIILGAILLALAWWVEQPLTVPFLFWTINIVNPLVWLGIPFMIIGGVSLLYGLVASGSSSSKSAISKPKMGANTKFVVALATATVFDVLDVFGVGEIPVVCDVADLIAMALLFPLIGTYALIAAVDLVPVLAVLPSKIASVIAWKLSKPSLEK